MKKFKKLLSILMVGAMVILPLNMSTQAKEIGNYSLKQSILYSTKAECNGEINTNNVNIRKGPSTSSASKGQIHKGTKVQASSLIVDASGRKWRYCVVPDLNLDGYVAEQFITFYK